MSKYSKTKRHNVMEKLEEIANNTFKNTGFFHNLNIESYPDSVRKILDGVGQDKWGNTALGVYQTGLFLTISLVYRNKDKYINTLGDLSGLELSLAAFENYCPNPKAYPKANLII